MKMMIYRIWDKLLAYIFIVVLSLWLYGNYIDFEEKRTLDLLQSEIDLATYRLNADLETEENLLLETAERLTLLSAQANEDSYRKILNRNFGNRQYAYSLWVKPDRIINGTDQVSPYDLEASGFKRYGNQIYWSVPYLDSERKTLLITIYLPVHLKGGNSGLVYREVALNDLMRNLIRLNAQYGGNGFLVSEERQILNFAPAVKIANNSLSKIQTFINNRETMGQMTQYKANHVMVSRLISTSNWYFVYYQEGMKSLEQIERRATVLLLVFAIILVLLIKDGIKAIRREPGEGDVRSLESGREIQAAKLLDYLKLIAFQQEVIKNSPHSGPLVEYLINLTNHVVSGKISNQNLMPSSVFVKWALGYSRYEGKINVEESSETTQLSIGAPMLNLSIELILALATLESDGGMQIKCDAPNRFIIFSFYGNLIKKVSELSDSLKDRHGVIDFMENISVKITTLGNKIILSEDERQKPSLQVYASETKIKQIPNQVYFLETVDEKNIVLKFYLEHLGITYQVYHGWEEVLENQVIFTSDKFLQSLIWEEHQTLSAQKCIIVFGEHAVEVNDRWHNVSRPYSLEKIVYALQTCQN